MPLRLSGTAFFFISMRDWEKRYLEKVPDTIFCVEKVPDTIFGKGGISPGFDGELEFTFSAILRACTRPTKIASSLSIKAGAACQGIRRSWP
jgi:hypothetical protein